MKWGNARGQPDDWSEYNRNKEEDQCKFGNRPDQWAVHGLVKPDEIVVWGLLSGVARIVLGIEVLDAEHIICGGDIGKQRCNDECNAYDVEATGFCGRDACLTERDANRPG